MRPAWTAAEVLALGVVTDVETAGSVLRLGRTKSRQLARAGDFPVPVLRVGIQYRVPVRGLLDLLGIEDDDPSPRPAA